MTTTVTSSIRSSSPDNSSCRKHHTPITPSPMRSPPRNCSLRRETSDRFGAITTTPPRLPPISRGLPEVSPEPSLAYSNNIHSSYCEEDLSYSVSYYEPLRIRDPVVYGRGSHETTQSDLMPHPLSYFQQHWQSPVHEKPQPTRIIRRGMEKMEMEPVVSGSAPMDRHGTKSGHLSIYASAATQDQDVNHDNAKTSRFRETYATTDQQDFLLDSYHNHNGDILPMPTLSMSIDDQNLLPPRRHGRLLTGDAFPDRLRRMLNDASPKGFDRIVSWHADGKSFRVHDPRKFINNDLIKSYFNQTKYKSFQRQLNLYGFKRFSNGSRVGSYAHPHFKRDEIYLPRLQRESKGKAVTGETKKKRAKKNKTNVKVEPLAEISDVSTCENRAHTEKNTRTHQIRNEDFLTSDDDSADDSGFFSLLEKVERPLSLSCMDDFDLGLLSQSSLDVDIVKESRDAEIDESIAEIFLEPDVGREQSISQAVSNPIGLPLKQNKQLLAHSFPWRVYDMLQDSDEHNFTHIVSWCGDSSFKVHEHAEFVARIMPQYFGGQHHYESFRRQLNAYGFVRVRRGPKRGIYSHANLRRGDRDSCNEIHRCHAN